MKKQEWLLVLHLAVNRFNDVVGISIGKEQIKIPVIIVIKELQPPSAHQPGCHADSGTAGLVVKGLVTIVLVNRKSLHVDVRHEQIHPSVLVEIGRIEPHPGAGATLAAVSHTRVRAAFLEPPLPAIHKDKV